MLQHTDKSALPRAIVRPRRRDIFFHFVKTGKLVGALFKDRRVSLARKISFCILILFLLAILAFPDTFDEIGLSVVLPLIGTVLGIPLDAGIDWVAFALLSVSLLRVFPAEIVSEHYQRLFKA